MKNKNITLMISSKITGKDKLIEKQISLPFIFEQNFSIPCKINKNTKLFIFLNKENNTPQNIGHIILAKTDVLQIDVKFLFDISKEGMVSIIAKNIDTGNSNKFLFDASNIINTHSEENTKKIISKQEWSKNIEVKKLKTIDDAEKEVNDLDLNSQVISKTIKVLKQKNKIVEEKAIVKKEKEMIRRNLLELQSKLKKSKIELQKAKEQLILDQQKLSIEQDASKKAMQVINKEKYNIIQDKTNNMKLLNQEFLEKNRLSNINLKIKIKKSKDDHNQKMHIFNQELINVRSRIKNEKQEVSLSLKETKFALRKKRYENWKKAREEKAEYKIEKKALQMELKREKEIYKHEIRNSIAQEKEKQLKHVIMQKDQIAFLKSEKIKIKQKNALSLFKARQETEGVNYTNLISENKHEIELQKIKNTNKETINSLLVDEVKNESIKKEKEIISNVSTSIDNSSESTPTEANVAREGVLTYSSTFHKFNEIGERVLKSISIPSNEKEIKKISRNALLNNIVKNYDLLKQQQLLVDYKEIVKNAYILSDKEYTTEEIDAGYKIVKMALVQKIPIAIGEYFLDTTSISGVHIFTANKLAPTNKIIYDINKIFSKNIVGNINKIIKYKLKNGGAIKIMEGLAIEIFEGQVQIAESIELFRV